MTTETSPTTTLRSALPVLVRDVAGPYLVYLVLHDAAGWSNLSALVGAAVAAAALVVRSVVISRHADPIAAVVLLTTLAGVVVALWTGDSRATLARESVVSASLGVVFLLSLARRPLLFSMIWALKEPGADAAEGWRASPEPVRRATRTGTAVWGVGLLLDALLRLVLVFTLPVSTAAGAVTGLTFVTVIVLVLWMRWYLPRHTRGLGGEQRGGQEAHRSGQPEVS